LAFSWLLHSRQHVADKPSLSSCPC
jgi:hypothetical protein